MQRINKHNSKKLSGYSLHQLVWLTGIHGIHNAADLGARTVYFDAHISGRNVTLDIETDLLEELIVHIDLNAKIISNESIKSTGKMKGLSFPLLLAQVAAAKKAGFRSLVLNAYGEPAIRDKYNGYITWGKYGYQMVDKTDKQAFLSALKKLGRQEKSLFELLIRPDGLRLWSDTIGFTWLGEFSLRSNSKSMQILETVKRQKNIS